MGGRSQGSFPKRLNKYYYGIPFRLPTVPSISLWPNLGIQGPVAYITVTPIHFFLSISQFYMEAFIKKISS